MGLDLVTLETFLLWRILGYVRRDLENCLCKCLMYNDLLLLLNIQNKEIATKFIGKDERNSSGKSRFIF